MGTAPVVFNGSNLYQPGVYSKRDMSGADAGGVDFSTLVLLGECKGGIPYNALVDYPNSYSRINWVSGSADLNNILRDGAAYYCALFALTPGTGDGKVSAPSKVGVIRVNQATRAANTILNVDAGAAIDQKSFDYGIWNNQIRRRILAGTTKGKKLTIKFQDQTIEGDNVTNELFTLAYIGAGSACSFTLDPIGNLVTVATGASGDNLTIDLTAYSTIGELCAYLATLINYSVVITGDPNFLIIQLDKVKIADAVNLKSGAYTVKAILQAVIDWFNYNSLYTVAILAAAATERRVPVNDLDFVFLTGATEGATVTITDYQNALDQICATNNIALLGICTSNAAIQAALNTHLTSMSSVSGRKERQGIVGGAVGDSSATKITNAQSLNNPLMGYFGSEIQRYDKNGVLRYWDGFYGAALALGAFAGGNVKFALTNKQLNVNGVKELYSPPTKDTYIQAGVMVLSPSDSGGIRCVKSVTTYQGANKIMNEFSAMRTALFITEDHRIYVEEMIGEPGDTTILESIKNRALLRLDYYVDQGYLIKDSKYGNAYRNFIFTVEGDVVKITYEGTLVLPVNFILVTHSFTIIGQKK